MEGKSDNKGDFQQFRRLEPDTNTWDSKPGFVVGRTGILAEELGHHH